jgi:hypothetical protein
MNLLSKLYDSLRLKSRRGRSAVKFQICVAAHFIRLFNAAVNPLKTKRKLFHLKTQFLPRSKYFLSRLKTQINLCYVRQKSVFVAI